MVVVRDAGAGRPPRLLVLTNMWPTPASPTHGSFVADQVERIRALVPEWGVDVMVVDGSRGKLEYVRAIGRLRSRLREERYDLVHAHYGLTGAVAAAQLRVPFIVTLHGSDLHIPWQRWISRAAALRARHLIFVSERLRRRAGRVSAGSSIIPCGVDLAVFRPVERAAARRRLGVAAGPVVLFAGNPARGVKNYPLFEAAVGSLPEPLRERVRVLALRDVPPREVPDYLNSADVVVVTSRYEGAGSVAKEALACGTPVVSVEVGDIPELLEGVAGCHLVDRDPAALGAAIAAALEEGERPDGHRRIAETGTEAGAVAERVVGVYRQVLGLAP